MSTNLLSEAGARPKKILSMMNEPGLTPRHIASHLQVYYEEHTHVNNIYFII